MPLGRVYPTRKAQLSEFLHFTGRLRLLHFLLAAVLFHFIDVKIGSERFVDSARKNIFATDLFTVQALIGIVIRAELHCEGDEGARMSRTRNPRSALATIMPDGTVIAGDAFS